MASLLTDIKKLLGIDEFYTQFDTDISISIKSALTFAKQLGLVMPEGFSITDDLSKYEIDNLEFIEEYIYLRTRLIFDPPQNSFAVEAIKEQIKEYEFRLNVEYDNWEWRGKEEEGS